MVRKQLFLKNKKKVLVQLSVERSQLTLPVPVYTGRRKQQFEHIDIFIRVKKILKWSNRVKSNIRQAKKVKNNSKNEGAHENCE